MSKYNAQKIVVDGITFDSKVESQYYLNLKNRKELGVIQKFELQPVFLLQEAFKKNGKTFRKIEYKADFLINHLDGSLEVIDVKGVLTESFKIKRKLYEKKYPMPLTLVKYVKKFGGWITLEEWEQQKKKVKH